MRWIPDFQVPEYFHNVNHKSSVASSSRTSQDAPLQEIHEKRLHDGLDDSPIPRFTWASLSMGLLVSMGGMIFGYDTGQISGFLGMPFFIERFGELDQDGNWYLSEVRSGLIVGLLSIGTLIGALGAAPIADRIGRKPTLAGSTIILYIGFIIQMASPVHKWYQFTMGRFVAGLAVGALSLVVPMYQAETAPRHIRGALISCYQLFITFGIFLAACINYGTQKTDDNSSWLIPLGIGFIWGGMLTVGMLFFSETPRFVYRRGHVDQARKIMSRVYGVPENHWAIHEEMEEMRVKLDSEAKAQGYFREYYNMFKADRMAYRIALGMLLQMFQQLTGANYFFYYGVGIFTTINVTNGFVAGMIMNGINFGSTFYGLYIVEHYGRRKSLITGALWMFLTFLIFGFVGHFSLENETNPDIRHKAGIALICMAAFMIFGFATTWGPMIWTICGELYPSQYRAQALALSTASNWFWNFLLAFFSPFIIKSIDYRYGFVFAACNIIGGCLVYFFVIEGQGRTLEEIDTMYIEKVLPWKSSKWVAPPPHEMASYRRGQSVASSDAAAVNKEAGDRPAEVDVDAQHREQRQE